MAKQHWWTKLLPNQNKIRWFDIIRTGSLFRTSSLHGDDGYSTIKNLVNTMRAMSNDSQIQTALSYYATDATLTNSNGDVIWATPVDDSSDSKVATQIVNRLLHEWHVNQLARDHILELATIGNLYLPTSYFYRPESEGVSMKGVALDNNTIPENDYKIIPSYKIPPEDILHVYLLGEEYGYMYKPENASKYYFLPPEAIIHFSLGGLLGDYTLDTQDENNRPQTFDIQFADPLLKNALQPTQTLSLLEDANVLSSLSRTIKFVNVRTGSDEEEMRETLDTIKSMIEQQMSLNTASGDIQSYVNPQAPNNLIYLAKVDDQDPISITDLNMAETNDADNRLLEYYQDKKLSVLGVPKEAMNFSSNEGLGGAGSVMSQRSALYANALQRLDTSYKEGWTTGFNEYFKQRGFSAYVDTFELHMQPIITTQSTLQSDKRSDSINQAQSLVDLMKSVGIDDKKQYKVALSEILSEALPTTGSEILSWKVNVEGDEDGSNNF